MSGGGAKLSFAKDIQPDIADVNATACNGAPCGCTNAGCHASGNPPILSKTNASANYSAVVPTYVAAGNPAMSPLLTSMVPNGSPSHGGGPRFSGTNDPTYQKWMMWISQGAPQ